MTAVVTIEAIDAKVPSVTVKAADGRRMSFKVENAKNLEGYKAGDQVEVTYTQALAVSVTSATK
jgi:Cu/Ag efflux protein CusF